MSWAKSCKYYLFATTGSLWVTMQKYVLSNATFLAKIYAKPLKLLLKTKTNTIILSCVVVMITRSNSILFTLFCVTLNFYCKYFLISKVTLLYSWHFTKYKNRKCKKSFCLINYLPNLLKKSIKNFTFYIFNVYIFIIS